MTITLPRQHFHLKKHVAAIHSANKLSLVQRKIANALLFNAYNELAEKHEHQIHIRTLSELIGYNSNELNAIKKALVSLISSVVEWNLIDKERVDSAGVWNASAIIADASIDGPICTYSYSNKMRQLLFRPEVYGRLNMQIQAKFKSSYGLVLYENCARYQNVQETPWFDMLVFRKLMGVDESKYPVFKDFRKRVIDIALKEVNEHSGMDIAYLLKKVGRKPVAIKFRVNTIKEDTGYSEPLSVEVLQDVRTFEQHQQKEASTSTLEIILKNEFAFSKQQIQETINRFGASYIEEKIALIKNSSSYKKKSIQHMTGYLHSALLKDYQHATPRLTLRAKTQPSPEKTDLSEAKNIKIRSDYEKYQQQALIEYFHQLPLIEQDKLYHLFAQAIKNTIYETLFVRDQLNNAIVVRKFTQFLKEQGGSVSAKLYTFEDFMVLK